MAEESCICLFALIIYSNNFASALILFVFPTNSELLSLPVIVGFFITQSPLLLFSNRFYLKYPNAATLSDPIQEV